MRENEAAKLLQQFSGTLRFGKRRLHLRASLTEKASETQDIFSEFLLEVKCEKEKITSRTREKLFPSAELYLPTWVVSRSDRRLWAALWFEVYAKPNIRERTADYYNRYITKHIVPCLGDIKLNKLTGRQIQKMYNDLLDHGRERVSQKEKNPGLSGTYVHGVHVMLHNCLNRAVKERLLVRNPADDVIVPKIDKKEMKILPPEQVKAYLKAASARGILPLFYLELTSGLRKGEIHSR